MSEDILLSIIIPTYKRGAIFFDCLSSVLQSVSGISSEIIIINDSKDSSVDISSYKNKHKIALYNNTKSGVASARNYGASVAKGTWLLFLDDDMLLRKENIDSYLKHTVSKEKICVNVEWEYPPDVILKIKKTAFGRFLIKYGFTTMRGWNNNPAWPLNSVVQVDFITSPNLFINRKDFFDAGGYDEHFPFAGYEDYSFSKILEAKGFKMYIDTTSVMYHNETDRIEAKEWYKRKQRGGETRRVAVDRGYKEIEIEYTAAKNLMYSLTPVIEPLLNFTLFFSSRFKFLDYLSFSCYKGLLGISLYKGYTKKNG